MRNVAAAAARLATGRFTPFLSPWCSRAELARLERWLEGEDLPDAAAALERTIAAGWGAGWSVRLTSSGRVAIRLTLEALELPRGSEVILPSFSCMGVVAPVVAAGLSPVLVDVDDQFNIRFESVCEAYGPDVKALILPHLSGCWARDTPRVVAWARERGIAVIEDLAQAAGLEVEGGRAGTFGVAAIFSSGPGKPLFGPGGGWVLTREPGLAARLAGRGLEQDPTARARVRAFLDAYGCAAGARGRRYLAQAIAGRLSGSVPVTPEGHPVSPAPQAIGEADAFWAAGQLERLSEIVSRRRRFAAYWRECLDAAAVADVRSGPTENSVFGKMLVCFPGESGAASARAFRRCLLAHGIETESSYTPLHLRPPFDRARRTSMPATDRGWRGAFSLPVRPNLEAGDLARIDAAIVAYARSTRR